MPQLRGEIEFASAPHAVADGVLHIRLLDVSRADASATLVAEEVIPAVSMRSVDDRLGFILDVPGLDPRATYTVEAHLDADGSGEVSVGDYRTMEHIPVTAATLDAAVTVPLRPIT
jgi:hypothetical protein